MHRIISPRARAQIEGAEYSVVPRLIATGAACLIDEFYLECHYNRADMKPDACIALLASLRGVGVAAYYGHM